MEFRYPAKGGIERAQRIVDRETAALVKALLRRTGHDNAELLAYKAGREWRDVRSPDINAYLKEHSCGCEISAKDFRTWHATVLAAVVLAGSPARSLTRRRRAVSAAMREVAEYLGNTPAVAKASYVDPRVVDLYHSGTVVDVSAAEPVSAFQDKAERATLDLLRDA